MAELLVRLLFCCFHLVGVRVLTCLLNSTGHISIHQEASLADITYLFESGALVDFEREELVRLVQGLFSDTPLRTKTIEKIRTLGLDVAGI